MIALVRGLADPAFAIQVWPDGAYGEARAIVAELPAPIDPDLLLARQVADEHTTQCTPGSYATGRYDNEPALRAILAAIKRVR